MSKKHISERSQMDETPYDQDDERAVRDYWSEATAHTGVEELRAKRGRPKKSPQEKKEKIAIRLDADVLAWYRAQGAGWQTRMNSVLRAFRDENDSR